MHTSGRALYSAYALTIHRPPIFFSHSRVHGGVLALSRYDRPFSERRRAMIDQREAQLQELYGELESYQMDALWRPRPGERGRDGAGAPYDPHLWKWKPMRAFMERAGHLVQTGPEAERRVIILANPSLAPARGATHSLTANLQMVIPGDVAPAHRHTATAIRFVIEGHGAATIVDGEPVLMNPGDLVLTPAWSWHGHL